jgi:hypothetical protein
MSGKISIESDIEGKRSEWNEFVENSSSGTIFHRLDFLDYHPDDRFEEHPLMFYYGGQRLLGVFPLALVKGENSVIAKSPYGGSYGGFAVNSDIKFRYADEMVELLLDYVRDIGAERLIIRPTPREQHHHPSSYYEYHYIENGFTVSDRELTNVVDLRRIDDNRFDIYERSCRSKIRKSIRRGVEIKEGSNAWADFHEILKQTQARHDKEPTHTLEELRHLSESFPERVRMSLAYTDEMPIAGIMQFLANEKTNFHFYNCHKVEYRDFAPVNQLIDREIEWSIENGFDLFDLGTTIENFKRNEGLIRFKESFGATGHFRNVYGKEV